MEMFMQADFVTATRDDLVEFSRALADGIAPARLGGGLPLIVSLSGTWNCGKSLVAEEIAGRISGISMNFRKVRGQGGAYHFQFRELAYIQQVSPWREERQTQKIKEAIEDQKNRPGMIFIQNAAEAARPVADIEITLKSSTPLPFYEILPLDETNTPSLMPLSRAGIEGLSLRRSYRAALAQNGPDWVRAVHLAIRKPDCMIPGFAEHLERFFQQPEVG